MNCDASGKCHSALWFPKIVLLLTGVIASFLIPNDVFDVYSMIARFGSAIFLLLQVLVLIDLAYRVNDKWNSEDRQKLLLSVSVAFYIVCLVLLIFFFKWFADGDCPRNKTLLAFTVIFTVIFTGISITEFCEHGSLLVSSVVSLYCYLLIFSALSSDPDTCNTSSNSDTPSVVVGLVVALFSITYSGYSASEVSLFQQESSDDTEKHVPLSGDAEAPATADRPLTKTKKAGHSDDDDDDDEKDEAVAEEDRVENRRFHLVMALCSMYLAMVLSNWGTNPQSSQTAFDAASTLSTTSLWIKAATQWITALIYIWTLVAPYILTGRDFSHR